MKPEFDRQFDSLLREHARRAGGSASREGGAPAAEGRSSEREMTAAAHLDADELSAFAENALPASARARHTAHLADCGDCRRLVSQIALASGVADEIERREPSVAVGLTAGAAASPAWRERLASLLRPGAWRYAMPLAALLVVSAAVLVLMNGRRRADLGSVALQRENAQPAQGQSAEAHHAADQTQQANSNAAETKSAAANDAPADADKAGARTRDSITLDGQDKSASPAPGGIVAGGTQSAPTEVSKSSVTEVPAAPPAAYTVAPVSVQTPTPVPPPAQVTLRDLAAAAPQPTPAPVKSEDAKAAESKEKDRYDERNAAPARKQGGHGPMRNESQQQANVRNRQAEELRAADAPKSDGNSARPGGASLATGRAARREAEKREGEKKSGDDREEEAARAGGETRSVGGRRFRRQGEAWVDTAYRPSQATVQVSRGSEQYRSLVGDEPELGRIANALGGEVIVVWKGRAYRIKP